MDADAAPVAVIGDGGDISPALQRLLGAGVGRLRILQPAPPDEGVTAAHNRIYDEHNPVRCERVMAGINTTPDLTQADCLALAAMLTATVLQTLPMEERQAALVGMGSMTGTMLAAMDQAGAIQQAAASSAYAG